MAKIVSRNAVSDLKHSLAENPATQNEILTKMVPDAPTEEFSNASLSLEKDQVTLRVAITSGAAGAIASWSGKGISSVVKGGTAGLYTVTLGAAYTQLLEVRVCSVLATVSAVAAAQVSMDPATYQADIRSSGEVVVQLADGAGAAVDPEEDEVTILTIVMNYAA